MKKNIFKYAALSAIALIGFVSCEEKQDFSIKEKIDPVTLYAETEYNLDMLQFAMAVNKAGKYSAEFNALLKEEIEKKYDGDYNVLVSQIIDKPIKNIENDKLKNKTVLTVRDLLNSLHVDCNSTESPTLKSAGKSVVDELTEKYPDIQIAMPVNIDKWDADSNFMVTFIPEEFDEQVTKYVPAIKRDGLDTILSVIKVPNEPVFVIGINERNLADKVLITNPGKPTDLTVSQTSNGIGLSWKKPTESSNIIGYRIYRKKGGDANFELLAAINGENNVAFFDKTTEAGKVFYYYVTAYNVISESDISNTVSVLGIRPANITDFSVELVTNKSAELRWSTENANYTKVQISKYVAGIDDAYKLFNEFDINTFSCFDNTLISGTKAVYQVQTQGGENSKSSSKFDFVHVPYRNPVASSFVKIKALECDLNKIEPWLKGAPEFLIKVLCMDSNNKSVVHEIHKGISLKYDKRTCYQGFDQFVLDWKPNIWYDMLTFAVVEDDKNKEYSTTVGVQSNSKGEMSLTTTLTSHPVEFDSKGDYCGVGYYSYFDKTDQTIIFPSFDFKITFGQ